MYALSYLVILAQDALNKSSFEKYGSRTRDSLACWMPECIGFNLIEAVLCHICRKERPGAVLVFMTGWEDISCLRDQLKAHPLLGDPNRVLLLTCHGSMATSEQVGYHFLLVSIRTWNLIKSWSFRKFHFCLKVSFAVHAFSQLILLFKTSW